MHMHPAHIMTPSHHRHCLYLHALFLLLTLTLSLSFSLSLSHDPSAITKLGFRFKPDALSLLFEKKKIFMNIYEEALVRDTWSVDYERKQGVGGLLVCVKLSPS